MIDFPDFGRDIRPTLFTLSGQSVKLVTATGTAVAIGSSVVAAVAMIKARRANAGTVYMGTSAVTNDETPATGGFQLDPGDAIVVSGTNLSTLYVNGTAGDGVTVLWWV